MILWDVSTTHREEWWFDHQVYVDLIHEFHGDINGDISPENMGCQCQAIANNTVDGC